ncbi:hypothetical protein KIPB_012452, partial [Kipferlia bialata]|eukprot:g12452.t1
MVSRKVARHKVSKHWLDASEAVARVTGHTFKDITLLAAALRHRSVVSSQETEEFRRSTTNQRLEHLGDAVLGAAVSQYLYE